MRVKIASERRTKMQNAINHSGYICVNRNNMAPDNLQRYAYDFENGELIIHAYEDIPELNGSSVILGCSFDNKPYLFCLPLVYESSAFSMFQRNVRLRADCVIKGYKSGIMFDEAVISFDET